MQMAQGDLRGLQVSAIALDASNEESQSLSSQRVSLSPASQLLNPPLSRVSRPTSHPLIPSIPRPLSDLDPSRFRLRKICLLHIVSKLPYVYFTYSLMLEIRFEFFSLWIFFMIKFPWTYHPWSFQISYLLYFVVKYN